MRLARLASAWRGRPWCWPIAMEQPLGKPKGMVYTQSQNTAATQTRGTRLHSLGMSPCRSVAIGTVGGAMPQSKGICIWDGRCRCSRRSCCQQRCRCCRAWREYGCRWKLKHILGGMEDGRASGHCLRCISVLGCCRLAPWMQRGP